MIKNSQNLDFERIVCKELARLERGSLISSYVEGSRLENLRRYVVSLLSDTTL